jgi:hypothetical protein
MQDRLFNNVPSDEQIAAATDHERLSLVGSRGRPLAQVIHVGNVSKLCSAGLNAKRVSSGERFGAEDKHQEIVGVTMLRQYSHCIGPIMARADGA